MGFFLLTRVNLVSAILQTWFLQKIKMFRVGSRQLFVNNRILLSLKSYSTNTSAAASKTAAPASSHNSTHHWDLERFLSVALLPAFASAAVYQSPYIDLALGVILPIHIHLGLEQIVLDYTNKQKALNLFLTWTVRASTVLALYGCWKFNTNDIGLSEAMRRLWNPKKSDSLAI